MGLDRLMSSGLPPGFIPGTKVQNNGEGIAASIRMTLVAAFMESSRAIRGVVATSTRLILKPVKCVTRTAT